MCDPEHLAEVQQYCSAATVMAEGGSNFLHLPNLRVPVANEHVERDGLLSLGPHTGYASRLYLSAPIPNKGNNWTIHTVLGRAWHTPSWNEVLPGRPIEMLLNHFGAYR